ncbi:MAG: dihydrodipicolinate reductase [Deltaproteobacteria bacterium]|nr:dihydrodipicolinate reductase [Deltaproteobacteria bacterium]
MKKKIRVIHYGLGPIGIETARLVFRKSMVESVGAVDISKDMLGKDLGEILGLDKRLGFSVTENAKDLFAGTKADVVLHTTGSRIRKIYPELEEIIRAGLNIISSSEELLFPLKENAGSARKVDALAKKHGVTVLGTGVNPGFVMDALPLFLTGVCQDVKKIHVERFVDAGTRRYPLQKKVGAGMTERAFREQVAQKTLGHVGLLESLYLVADNLGMSLDDVNETVEPVITPKVVKTAYFSLRPGDVAGIKHTAEGIKDGEKIITLDLRMFIGCEEPYDSVHIVGTPEIRLRIEGGVAGDQATAAILVNSISAVMDAQPGLMTVKDMPAAHFTR